MIYFVLDLKNFKVEQKFCNNINIYIENLQKQSKQKLIKTIFISHREKQYNYILESESRDYLKVFFTKEPTCLVIDHQNGKHETITFQNLIKTISDDLTLNSDFFTAHLALQKINSKSNYDSEFYITAGYDYILIKKKNFCPLSKTFSYTKWKEYIVEIQHKLIYQ